MIGLAQANSRFIPVKDGTFHVVVTSPPYWGLRDYGTGKFVGGDPACNHLVGRFEHKVSAKQLSNTGSAGHQASDICPKCGAKRIDAQVGNEPLHDCLAWAPIMPRFRRSWFTVV